VARGPLNKALDRMYEAFGAPVTARSSSIAEIVQPIADVDTFVPMPWFNAPLDQQAPGGDSAIFDLEIPTGTTCTDFQMKIPASVFLVISSQTQPIVIGGVSRTSWLDGRASRSLLAFTNAVLVAPAPQYNILGSIYETQFFQFAPIKGPRHFIVASLIPTVPFASINIFWREVASPAA